MGFFSGPMTFRRLRVMPTHEIEQPHRPQEGMLDRLAEFAFGSSKMVSGDGVEHGWGGGKHILDTKFEWGKNVVDDTLHWCLRVDTNKLPADLLRSYYEIDLAALSRDNPSGHASARQKREAKESARERLEHEAKDGRFIKRKAGELLWDFRRGELLFACTGYGHDARLRLLFRESFGLELEVITAGSLAVRFATERAWEGKLLEIRPADFLPGLSGKDVAWVPDEASRDFLGNEFLLWLWYQCSESEGEIKLGDGTSVTAFFAKTLSLDCPRGMTGKDTFSSEGPARMPEALRGIQGGKLPRKAGLTTVRHDMQVTGTLKPEDQLWSGAKFPAVEEEDAAAIRSARLGQIRDFIETNDLLFGEFLAHRLSGTWPNLLRRMTRWLKREAAV